MLLFMYLTALVLLLTHFLINLFNVSSEHSKHHFFLNQLQFFIQ